MDRDDIRQADVFISWTSADVELKNKIYKYLKDDKKLNVLESDHGLCTGDFEIWSKEAVPKAHVFLIIASEFAFNSEYVPVELQVALFMPDAANRTLPIVKNLKSSLYNQSFTNLSSNEENSLCLADENKDQSLREKNVSAIISKDWKFDKAKLNEIYEKVIRLLVNRLSIIYKNELKEKLYMDISPLLNETERQNFTYEDIYVPRTLSRSNIDNESFKEISSFEDILDEKNISYIFGEGGCGKTEFIKNLSKSLDDERIIIILKCSEVATALQKTKLQSKSNIIFKKIYEKFESICGNTVYCSKEDFKSILINHQIVLVFDGLDEIISEELTKKFIDAVKEYYEHTYHNGIPPKLIITGRRESDSNKLIFFHKGNQLPIECLKLAKFNEDNIKQLINNLFLKLSNTEKGNQFYLAISDIDNELKSNPLLLTQLALVYKEKETVPKTILEIFDNVTEVVLKNDKLNKQLSVDNKFFDMIDSKRLKFWLKKFAMERYISLSEGEDLSEEKIFKIIFEKTGKFEESDLDVRTAYLVEYLKNRSILVENKFFHKTLLEYFTAVGFFETIYKGGTMKIENLQQLFTHYNDSYWEQVLEMFFLKADNELSKEKMGLLLNNILKKKNIIDYKLLFDSCEKLIHQKSIFKTLLIKDILIKSLSGVFPPYGPLFYYVPKYNSFESCIYALNEEELKGNAKALALVRDLCFIYGPYNNITEITNAVDGQTLFDAAKKDLDFSGVRKALCEIFYLGDTKFTGGDDIYPRCFNVLEAKLLRDYGIGIFGRVSNPFTDELSLFKHEQYNLIGDEFVGFISCPNDEMIENKLREFGGEKLTCIAFTPNHEKFELYRFYRLSIKQIYLDECCISAEHFHDFYCLTRGILISSIGLWYLTPKVVIPEGIGKIECKLFMGVKTLKEIKFPQSLKVIEEYAFANCINLTKIEFLEGVCEIEKYAFANCKELREINIPKSLRYVGYGIFFNCHNLQIQEEMKNVIGSNNLFLGEKLYTTQWTKNDPFDKCRVSFEEVEYILWKLNDGFGDFRRLKLSLKFHLNNSAVHHNYHWEYISLNWEYISLNPLKRNPPSIVHFDKFIDKIFNVQKIKKDIEDNYLKNVEEIYNSYFRVPYRIKTLKKKDIKHPYIISILELHPKVSVIDLSACENCENLKTVISKGLKYIKKFAFRNCIHLVDMDLSIGLKDIAEGSFENCKSLPKIELAEGVTVIKKSAFKGCENLKEVIIPKSVKCIEESAFENCKSLPKIELAEGVTVIKKSAFKGCEDLKEVIIPKSVEYMEESTFEDCISLPGVELPKQITVLEKQVFKGCNSLKNIIWPEKLEKIGVSAFEDCKSIPNLVIPEAVTKIESFAFRRCTNLAGIITNHNLMFLEDGVFFDCLNLKKIRISANFENDIERIFGEIDHNIIDWIDKK